MTRSTQVNPLDSALESILTENWVTGTSKTGKHKKIDVVVTLGMFDTIATYVVTCDIYFGRFRTKDRAIDAFNDL